MLIVLSLLFQENVSENNRTHIDLDLVKIKTSYLVQLLLQALVHHHCHLIEMTFPIIRLQFPVQNGDSLIPIEGDHHYFGCIDENINAYLNEKYIQEFKKYYKLEFEKYKNISIEILEFLKSDFEVSPSSSPSITNLQGCWRKSSSPPLSIVLGVQSGGGWWLSLDLGGNT